MRFRQGGEEPGHPRLRARPRYAQGSPPAAELAADPVLYLYLFALPLLVFAAFGGLLGGRKDRLLAANALLRDLSISDPLTGLRNTRYFWERLGEEYARVLRTGEPASVLVVDLDHFKDVNDRHGHVAGDRVLRGTAEAIAAAIRRADTAARVEDMAARVGGEEFAVLLPGTGLEDAAAVAERVRTEIAALEVPVRDGERVGITASVGVACVAGELPGGDLALFTAADRARCEGRGLVLHPGHGPLPVRAVPLRHGCAPPFHGRRGPCGFHSRPSSSCACSSATTWRSGRRSRSSTRPPRE